MVFQTGMYGAAAIGAVVASSFADKEERGAAWTCSALLLAMWLVYISAWTKWSPALFLSAYVVDTDSIDIWSLNNMLAGIATFIVARNFWWGLLLFGLLLNATLVDALYWAKLVDWQAFRATSNLTFVAEEAVFYAIGASGAWNAVASVARSIRDRFAVSRVHQAHNPMARERR